MTTFVEPIRPGEFIITEVSGPHFREDGLFAAGQNTQAGTVLAKNASGEFVQLDDTASDGTEVAAGLAYAAVDATNSARRGVVLTRLSVVNDDLLTWPAAISNENKAAAIAKLAESFLIVR